MAEQENLQTSTGTKRAENFIATYANNVQFDTSLYDIRLIFGEEKKQEGKDIVEERVSITLPWLQAKIMSVYLQLQLAFHETYQGAINVPPNLLPDPSLFDPETAENQSTKAFCIKVQQILASI